MKSTVKFRKYGLDQIRFFDMFALVDKATVKLDCKFCRGRAFTVVAKNNSALNPYIQSGTLNGRALTRSWITHREITHGRKLVLNMGPTPNFGWGEATADRPAQALNP